MISIVNNKISDTDKALILSNLERKKNYKGRIHDEARNFFIKNLEIIGEGLEFLDKELRVAGGDVDIIAKKDQIFYLIEIKTRLSRNYVDIKRCIEQLTDQMKGIKYIISLFKNEDVKIKLILVDYVRDLGKTIVRYLSNSGEIEQIREMNLKAD